MLTVLQLKKFLEDYPDHFEITDSRGKPFCHMVNRPEDMLTLSTQKPIGYCNKCGEYVYPEIELDYPAYCPTCDENRYSFEFKSLEDEIVEVE